MLRFLYLILLSWISMVPVLCTVETQLFISFTGRIITRQEYEEHIKENTTFWCVNEIKPCDYHEGRRLDGSCNNLRYPSSGAAHTPPLDVLLPVHDKDFKPRRGKNGEDLPLSRKVRTTLLPEGRVPDSYFTHLVTYFSVFMSADLLSFHDTINYLVWRDCCDKKADSDPECARQYIPNDDPVHRFSNERCFNLTHPWTFQARGCVKNSTRPERIITATPLFDLSHIYSNNTKIRLFKDGLLNYEMEEGRMWPPSFKPNIKLCLLNQGSETRCHDIGEESSNGILGTNLFTIWMWRHHNRVATQLARLNPCWGDERLFHTARDINIAVVTQIFYYELNALLLGEENLLREGILSPTPTHRDLYNENVPPAVSMEYGLVLRWMHTIQEGIAKMYDTEGNYLKSIPIVNLTLRTGYLADQNHIDYMTQGAFRQSAANIDDIVDPDIAEIGLGPLQRVSDLPTSDLAKNRLFSLAPYTWYRKACFGETIRTFDDLIVAMEPEKIELFKELYSSVEDMELLAGVWTERAVRGARVPATFYCLVVEQLRRSAASDRHWYEAADRPDAFTIHQLLEIRKATIARLMCDVGDGVAAIQPRAFLLPGPGNEIGSCSNIKKIDLNAWKDPRCHYL